MQKVEKTEFEQDHCIWVFIFYLHELVKKTFKCNEQKIIMVCLFNILIL